MAKIVSPLFTNLIRSGRVLPHSYNAAFNSSYSKSNSNFNFNLNSDSNSNSKIVSPLSTNSVRSGRDSNNAAFNFNFNSNISTTTPTNLIYRYRKVRFDSPSDKFTKVSKLRYPNDGDDDSVCFNYPGYLYISSHSHGIVCFSNCRDDIFLFNPSTRLFLPLHPPPLLSSHILSNLPLLYDDYDDDDDTFDPDAYCNEIGVRFCYYPDSNHFKVVRFVGYEDRDGLLNTLADVYNSNTGQWTQILNTPLRGHTPWDFVHDYVFHNGVHYSITYTYDQEFIQSFDINRELFNPLIPISNVTYFSQIRQLCIWNGSVVLLSYPTYQGEPDTGIHILHIWGIDKDESGAVSLSELFTFTCNSSWCPLLFVNSDELLMNDDDQNVFSYNLKTQEIKYLHVKADQVSIFENSSVSFQGETCKHERAIS